MEHINSSSQKLSGTDWQTLGELEVRADSDIEQAIQIWLNKILHPLNLNSDLLHRILRSAYEAATRALYLQDTGIGFQHVHLLAFSSRGYDIKGQTWGFFRLEKLQSAADAESPNHAIEFYLYLEG